MKDLHLVLEQVWWLGNVLSDHWLVPKEENISLRCDKIAAFSVAAEIVIFKMTNKIVLMMIMNDWGYPSVNVFSFHIPEELQEYIWQTYRWCFSSSSSILINK